MQKSLFTKYFSVCAAIILLSTTVLSVVLLALTANYLKNDKLSLLETNAGHAAAIALQDYANNGYTGLINKDSVIDGFTLLSKSINADLFLVDVEGKTHVCTHRSPCNHTAYLVPKAIVRRAGDEGRYQELGRLGGIYDEQYYTVGVPMKVNGQMVGAVFASLNAQSLSRLITTTLKMFMFSALIVMAVTCIIVYFVTRRLVRPLREMLAATQSFAKGDFSVRVPVERYDEIGKLAMAFNAMATSLSSQESSRRSFIANVSHELKTPMTTIAGFIDGILDGTIPEEKRDQYLGIVSEEVKRLSRLVRSMLGIARIEAGEMKLTPSAFDINDIVCRTVFTFERSIEEKHLDIQGLDAGKVMVNADPDLIHQVVYNLTENAVKFAGEGGYIRVSYQQEGAMTYVGIRNSGEGLTKEEIPRIFERFYKTDRSRSMDKTGVGLGLHIVRSIINLHGGEIIVKSVEGEYCEFRFSLPCAAKSAQSLFRKNEKLKP
ncbi:MAG: HAMP domain-containing histidine kinase [Provencibacterium sp.]|jgi:signal transduction histidine kinase|nr:HAMP domain-containing histidine kinase [Provencibacterium sp.]